MPCPVLTGASAPSPVSRTCNQRALPTLFALASMRPPTTTGQKVCLEFGKSPRGLLRSRPRFSCARPSRLRRSRFQSQAVTSSHPTGLRFCFRCRRYSEGNQEGRISRQSVPRQLIHTHVTLHVLRPSRYRTKMTNEARPCNTEVLPFQ